MAAILFLFPEVGSARPYITSVDGGGGGGGGGLVSIVQCLYCTQ